MRLQHTDKNRLPLLAKFVEEKRTPKALLILWGYFLISFIEEKYENNAIVRQLRTVVLLWKRIGANRKQMLRLTANGVGLDIPAGENIGLFSCPQFVPKIAVFGRGEAGGVFELVRSVGKCRAVQMKAFLQGQVDRVDAFVQPSADGQKRIVLGRAPAIKWTILSMINEVHTHNALYHIGFLHI